MVAKTERRSVNWSAKVSNVTPWLMLSGARAVRPSILKDHGITCVINATIELPLLSIDGIEIIAVRVPDSSEAILNPYFHSIADKIEQIRLEDGRVLVHCTAGVSRSSALVLAYMIKYQRVSLRQAFRQLQKVRPVVRPNSNFVSQLIDFEDEIIGSKSVTLVTAQNLSIPDIYEEEFHRLNSNSWTDMIKARKNMNNHFS